MLTTLEAVNQRNDMATQKAKKPEEYSEQELALQLQELEKQQQLLRQIRLDKLRKQSQELVNEIKESLSHAAELVNKLRDSGLDWTYDASYDSILHELGLQVAGPKVIPVDQDFVKELLAFLANKAPQTKEQIANGILNTEGKPKYSKATINLKLGAVQRENLVALSKAGRTNLYSLRD